MKKKSRLFWATVMVALCTSGLSYYSGEVFAEEYTKGLVGDYDKDIKTVGDHVVKNGEDNLTYDFSTQEETIFRLAKSKYGVNVPAESKIHIKANKLKIYNLRKLDGMGGIGMPGGGTLDIDGDVYIETLGKSYINSGISASNGGTGVSGKSTIHIHGDLIMRKNDSNDPWGVANTKEIHGGYEKDGYFGSRWAPSGIYLGTSGGSTFDIDGKVDLAVKGIAVTTDPYYATKDMAEYDLAVININGGRIETPVDKTEGYYSLANFGGTINVNMNSTKDDASTHDVNMVGNIIAMKNHKGSGGSDVYKSGRINLGLSTNKSSWRGVVDNAGKDYAGEVNIYLKNGAQWIYEATGMVDGLQAQNMPQYSAPHYSVYDGISHINLLSGGRTEQERGYVFVKDKADLDIMTYKGHTEFIYNHKEDGSDTGKYIGGNVRVQNALPGSSIMMMTSNTGIDMGNKDAVRKALNGLAGKLYYANSVQGEKNLKGTARIASGLTAGAASLEIGNITYKSTDGQGQVISDPNPDKPKPNPDPDNPEPNPDPDKPKPNPDPQIEDTSLIMRGVQNGIVSLTANWKHMIANDFYRGDELFRGAEIGPWARVYGGDNSYKKATANINGSFWGAEFGYDTDFKDWVVGTSIQYYDGKGTYLGADKNEYSFYSFNVYGIKKFKNNAQLDVIVKVGNLSNKIYAYNEMGQKIESDYDTMGYALNTKYSVEFEKNQGKYIRPQIQLLLTNVRDVDFTGHLGDMVMDVKQGSFNSLTGIAGIEFGRRSPGGVIYARLDLAHDFAGDVDVTYSAPDGGIKKMKSNLDDTWLRVVVGGDYKVNDRVAVGLDLNRTLSGDYKQKWQANAKIQYRF